MQYFTTTQAAAVLHVDPSRVRLLCQRGRIRTIRIGNTYGIAEDVLDQFAAQERRPGRPRKDAILQANGEVPVEPNLRSSNP